MATSAVQNPTPVNGGESKSSRKKKAKDSAANGSASPAIPEVNKESSSQGPKEDGDGSYEHPYIKDLNKQIRNTHKKLSGMQKIDAIIAENPKTSLDDLVAQRKINSDQRAAALKKPQLQQHLAALEEQINQYRKFDSEYQTLLQKQKDELTSQHEKELEKIRDELRVQGVTAGAAELKKKLLVFSQFLRAAAAKRNEDDAQADEQESRAFEGALLLVYGGDDTAVETALKLIEGSDEHVPSIEGEMLSVKYSQVKQKSAAYEPFQAQENWVDSVAEATAGTAAGQAGSDPTLTHAGLTELDTVRAPNGAAAEEQITSPPQGESGDMAGNIAGDRWDSTNAGAEKTPLEGDYQMVPRPQEELETPAVAAPAAGQQEKPMWADDPTYDTGASGNIAGEGWDMKAAGEQADNSWAGADPTAQPGADGWADGAVDSAVVPEEGDGFHQVPGRHRGRGGRGRGGDGEFRGRGRGRGGFRGDGEFRGRGRGGFRGGRGESGEFRGRGGGYRGRGMRGGAEGQTRAS